MEQIKFCDCCNKPKKCTYNESQKRAIYNYYERNPNKNNENAKQYYDRMKENPEWRAKYNERMRNNALKRKEKKKLET